MQISLFSLQALILKALLDILFIFYVFIFILSIYNKFNLSYIVMTKMLNICTKFDGKEGIIIKMLPKIFVGCEIRAL